MLDDLGLLPALLWHFDRFTVQTNVYVNFEHRGISQERFRPNIETAAYRIIQEALTNVARYAGVSKVKVSITSNAVFLKVEVIDQGGGFDYEKALMRNEGNGLSGMRERAVLLGGAFSLISGPGKGTHLAAYLPLDGPLDKEPG
jgi:signal transduction histidine kinase